MWPIKRKAKFRNRRGIIEFCFRTTSLINGMSIDYDDCAALVEEVERIGKYSRVKIISVSNCTLSDARSFLGDLILSSEVEWEDPISEGILEVLGG